MYLTAAPAPLSQDPLPFRSTDIPTLVEKMHGYRLTKGELIMIINLRPSTMAQLWACIEEVEERFTEEKQQEMLDIIAQVLGSFPAGEDADAADANPVASIEGMAT